MFNFINNIMERRFLSGALFGSLMLLGVTALSGCGEEKEDESGEGGGDGSEVQAPNPFEEGHVDKDGSNPFEA